MNTLMNVNNGTATALPWNFHKKSRMCIHKVGAYTTVLNGTTGVSQEWSQLSAVESFKTTASKQTIEQS